MAEKGTFPTGFIKLRSARRMEHKKQSFCVGRNKEPHLSYHACTLLSESVADWPGHFTLSFTPTELFSCWEQDEMPKGIFLSTNGHSALVDLWPHCDSGRQAWAAIKSQQPGHWHCNVMGGNTQDSVRVQLSCGLADCAGEAVDLWSEHAWILKPLQKNCSTSKGCPDGYYQFQSAVRHKLGLQDKWLALRGTGESMEQLTIGDQDSAVVLKLEHISGTSNHVFIKALPGVYRLYLTALEHQPGVQFSRNRDASGRQFWKATSADYPSPAAWNLSVTKGHDKVKGRHSLSCPTGDTHETYIDLWHEHPWLVEAAV